MPSASVASNKRLRKACRFFVLLLVIVCLGVASFSDPAAAARKKAKKRVAVDKSASIVIEADTPWSSAPNAMYSVMSFIPHR